MPLHARQPHLSAAAPDAFPTPRYRRAETPEERGRGEGHDGTTTLLLPLVNSARCASVAPEMMQREHAAA